MEEGLLPHHRSIADDGPAIDEERRLCYVGVTRAQDELTVTLALGRHKWGKCRPTIPSRFIYELLGKADQPQAIEHRRRAAAEFRRGGRAAKPAGPQAAKPPVAAAGASRAGHSKPPAGRVSKGRKHSPSARQRASKRAR
jgi:ATP-dependent exoDNAse (exonuclease V) beta subunit